MNNHCTQPQAHPDRCGCEPDAFQIARHSKRLVEQQRERIADLEAENAALKHRCGMLDLELENAEERRIQAERQAAILRQHESDYMEAAEGARKALSAENARLVERAGYLVEFAQQMARQQGEPYYRLLAEATLKKWSEP